MSVPYSYLCKFLTESNLIEGITEFHMVDQLAAAGKFLALPRIEIGDLVNFVGVIQPDAHLRTNLFDDVTVGGYTPPRGGPHIFSLLLVLLRTTNFRHSPDAWGTHLEYERLHPFTDGNGRSGRMLWLWHVQKRITSDSIGFLHTFYYNTLSDSQED